MAGQSWRIEASMHGTGTGLRRLAGARDRGVPESGMASSGGELADTPESGRQPGDRRAHFGGPKRSSGSQDSTRPVCQPSNGDVTQTIQAPESPGRFNPRPRRATSSRSLPALGTSPRRERSWTGSGPRRERATGPGNPRRGPPRKAKAESEDGGLARRPAVRGRLRPPGLSLPLEGALDVSRRQGMAARCGSGARPKSITPYTQSSCV